MMKNKKAVATIGVLGLIALGGASYAVMHSDTDDTNTEVAKKLVPKAHRRPPRKSSL